MSTKVCKGCGEEKSIIEFGKDKYKKSGYKGSCKVCLRDKARLSRKENPERSRKTSKSYRLRNRDKELARYIRYNKENPEVRAAHSAKRRAYHKNATPPWLTDVFYRLRNWGKC